MQMSHRIIRSTLIILFCLFVELFLYNIRNPWFSKNLKLMESVAERCRPGIEPRI